jgi:tight adherence protein C
MDPILYALLFGVVAAVGVFVAVWSLRPAPMSSADLAESRVRAYESALPIAVTELELQQPFYRRILQPTIRRLGRFLDQSMPAKSREKIRQRLEQAGRLTTLSAGDFIAWRYAFTGIFTIVGLAIGLLTGSPVMVALGAAIGMAAGLYLPNLWLRWQVGRRRTEIQLELPDVMDALVVCVEAGLTFEAAMEKVVEKYDTALSEELGRVLQETRLGRPRLEALSDMGTRCGVEELNNLVQAIIQSEQLGAGMVRILRIQADDLRRRRLMFAEERGGRAPLKMLIPMVGCIFPTLWIILLGPAGLLAIKVLTGR